MYSIKDVIYKKREELLSSLEIEDSDLTDNELQSLILMGFYNLCILDEESSLLVKNSLFLSLVELPDKELIRKLNLSFEDASEISRYNALIEVYYKSNLPPDILEEIFLYSSNMNTIMNMSKNINIEKLLKDKKNIRILINNLIMDNKSLLLDKKYLLEEIDDFEIDNLEDIKSWYEKRYFTPNYDKYYTIEYCITKSIELGYLNILSNLLKKNNILTISVEISMIIFESNSFYELYDLFIENNIDLSSSIISSVSKVNINNKNLDYEEEFLDKIRYILFKGSKNIVSLINGSQDNYICIMSLAYPFSPIFIMMYDLAKTMNNLKYNFDENLSLKMNERIYDRERICDTGNENDIISLSIIENISVELNVRLIIKVLHFIKFKLCPRHFIKYNTLERYFNYLIFLYDKLPKKNTEVIKTKYPIIWNDYISIKNISDLKYFLSTIRGCTCNNEILEFMNNKLSNPIFKDIDFT